MQETIARARGTTRWTVLTGVLMVTPAMIGGLTATAQAASASAQVTQVQQRDFNIPAQPLTDALTLFGRQSGLQVSVDAALVRGLSSPGARGTMTPAQALQSLLAGTGFTWQFVDGNTVMLAKTEDMGAMTLGPITVTGERAVRSLQDTASSVAVYENETIETRPGLRSVDDIMDGVANVTTSGTGNIAPTVRGVDGTGPAQGADAFFAGTRPRLNIQVDGRPLSYNEVVFGSVSLWDVEQVEVLRGPQSTLQGRNSIAGTVVVKTKDPTYEPEAGARFMAGNMDTSQFAGFVSGPIVDDQVAFRLSFDRKASESFVHMQPYRDIDPEEYLTTTVRGKLLIEPKSLDAFSALFTLNHTEHSAPQSEWVARPFDTHVSSYPSQPVFNPRTTAGTIDTTYKLSDRLALEGTASLTDVLVRRHALDADGNAKIDGHELVLEPRVRFSGDRLNGVTGLYFFRAKQDEFIDFPADGNFEDDTTTVAAFGEATYAVLDDIDLTFGARLEQEKRRRTGGAGVFAIDLDETYQAFLPKLGLAWHATEQLTVGAIVSRGYNGGGAGFTYNAPFESYTFDPEYVWTYETYARADLLDGKLSLTGNLFYSRYKDMQLPFDLNPDPAVWSVVIRNADEAVTYGAEVGARWLAAPGLELFGDLGLLKTEITEYPGSNVEGHELAQAPAFTSDVGFNYRHHSGIEFGADARFSDAYYSSVSNDPRGKTDPYVVVNTQVGYRTHNDRVGLRVFAFVNNVFDSDEAISLEPGATAADDTANLLRPRTFGVGVEMTF